MRLGGKALGAGLTLVLALSPFVHASGAPQKKRPPARAKKGTAAQTKTEPQPVSEVARLRAQLVQATKDYKSSLEQLLTHYEAEVKRADERVVKSRELYSAGLVSKRALDEDSLAAETARAKVARVEGQLKSADVQIAETLVEAEAEEAAAKALAQAKSAPRAPGGLLTTTGYIRVNGQAEFDDETAARKVLCHDRSAVEPHGPLGDGEPEAGAARLARARVVHAVEGAEDLLQRGFGHAGALVTHRDDGLARAARAPAAQRNLHGRPLRRVAHGVAHDVLDGAPQ
jgi:hypothetical protein